jgi:hypothetical protein
LAGLGVRVIGVERGSAICDRSICATSPDRRLVEWI